MRGGERSGAGGRGCFASADSQRTDSERAKFLFALVLEHYGLSQSNAKAHYCTAPLPAPLEQTTWIVLMRSSQQQPRGKKERKWQRLGQRTEPLALDTTAGGNRRRRREKTDQPTMGEEFEGVPLASAEPAVGFLRSATAVGACGWWRTRLRERDIVGIQRRPTRLS